MKRFRVGPLRSRLFLSIVMRQDSESQLLHSFEVLDPIRFPRFTTVG